MIKLSAKAVKIARWLKKNEHGYSSWKPNDAWPNYTHMYISGNGKSINVPIEVWDELRDLLDYCIGDHMFYPNKKLRKYLKAIK